MSPSPQHLPFSFSLSFCFIILQVSKDIGAIKNEAAKAFLRSQVFLRPTATWPLFSASLTLSHLSFRSLLSRLSALFITILWECACVGSLALAPLLSRSRQDRTFTFLDSLVLCLQLSLSLSPWKFDDVAPSLSRQVSPSPNATVSLSLWQLPVRASGFVFTTDKASCRHCCPSSSSPFALRPPSHLPRLALSLSLVRLLGRRPAGASVPASSCQCFYYGGALQGSRTFKKIHGQEQKTKQTQNRK